MSPVLRTKPFANIAYPPTRAHWTPCWPSSPQTISVSAHVARRAVRGGGDPLSGDALAACGRTASAARRRANLRSLSKNLIRHQLHHVAVCLLVAAVAPHPARPLQQHRSWRVLGEATLLLRGPSWKPIRLPLGALSDLPHRLPSARRRRFYTGLSRPATDNLRAPSPSPRAGPRRCLSAGRGRPRTAPPPSAASPGARPRRRGGAGCRVASRSRGRRAPLRARRRRGTRPRPPPAPPTESPGPPAPPARPPCPPSPAPPRLSDARWHAIKPPLARVPRLGLLPKPPPGRARDSRRCPPAEEGP